MKFTEDIKFKLEKLKNRMALDIKGRYFWERELELFFVVGWKTEKVPEKKGFFGHDEYEKLTEIEVIYPKHVDTKFIGVFKADPMILDRLEKGRELFLKLKADVSKFGFEVIKIKEEI